MTKQALRKLYLQKRNNLTEAEYTQFNFQIYQHFFASVDLSFIKIIHTYLPIASKREVDTWLIIDRIKREFPHIRISIPKVSPQNNTLDNFYFEGLHQLTTNEWGIQEPKQGIPTEIKKIDMVLVPLLAFDAHGHRVGYGKGYYDIFLKTCRPDCQRIGLSLFSSVENIDDIYSMDVSLHQCITPEGLIEF
ncbi:MAG TPA: 5-formyltetrahydrofolate cyclo-ligase [Cyclobacteriaceae bacterium]|jgi:5-formyltetrahydrofolate cyclo-ligase|nr:5-formyltetrahydrofolate cyclo-ligase [Cytophagales bacterium]HMR56862.1 5-formyltetrahydrofolate cyclo-ligase [Cyclobacteriaceae bacterium]HRE67536.1 5-formyltetrahydrofolate cyclo-ligase [Cyclobacteriaceae bacterium]HRF33357.1 5-formyltetrahydrofolate cyclo-ligase [Cyclobacteriaceae bacterium]